MGFDGKRRGEGDLRGGSLRDGVVQLLQVGLLGLDGDDGHQIEPDRTTAFGADGLGVLGQELHDVGLLELAGLLVGSREAFGGQELVRGAF